MDQVFWLSVITASIAFTLTETKLFLPLREWTLKKSRFLGKLIHCGYCSAHWIAFALVAIYRPRLLESLPLLDYFLTALAIAWLASIQWILMCILMKKGDK
jgi:hypothetical protein